jgi:hypothetical protein
MLRNQVAHWIGTGWRDQSEWGGAIGRNTQLAALSSNIPVFNLDILSPVAHPIKASMIERISTFLMLDSVF